MRVRTLWPCVRLQPPSAELEQLYAHLEDGDSTEDLVKVAGRIMSKRVQGKIAFLGLRDATGDMQLFCRINELGEEAFGRLKDLDVGDWIGVEGAMMRTRRGQLSVAVSSFELLSKSIRPLPEKFHGLADKETRYRQRYVDLVMNPEVKQVFEKRFKIVAAIRRYMEDQGFYEVETPFLHPILGGANAKRSSRTSRARSRLLPAHRHRLPLKRLLVGGFEKVFEIAVSSATRAWTRTTTLSSPPWRHTSLLRPQRHDGSHRGLHQGGG